MPDAGVPSDPTAFKPRRATGRSGAVTLNAFAAALRAADPSIAVHRALSSEPPSPGARVVATGKAASPMIAGCAEFAHRLTFGPMLLPEETPVSIDEAKFPGLEVLRGTHPVPTRGGFEASRALFRFASELGPGDEVLYLVSGGTSSLFEVHDPDLDPGEVIEVYDLLLRSGAPIDEINVARSALSVSKSGGLARAASPARVRTLAVSDVLGDDPAAIGSGPTAPGAVPNARAALDWFERTGLVDRLPRGVRRYLKNRASSGSTPALASENEANAFEVIASNDLAAEAARQALANDGVRLLDPPAPHLHGDAAAFAATLARHFSENVAPAAANGPVGYAIGGETTVQVPSDAGRGGRNRHLALSAAKLLAGVEAATVLAAGTDGADGGKDAAGALIDGKVADELRAAGHDPDRSLARFDSGTALGALGADLVTGPTGTNVGDILVVVAGLEEPGRA